VPTAGGRSKGPATNVADVDDTRLLRSSVMDSLDKAAKALRAEYPSAHISAHSYESDAYALCANLSVILGDPADADEDAVISVNVTRDLASVTADVSRGDGEVLSEREHQRVDAEVVRDIDAFLASALETVRHVLHETAP